MKELIEKYQLRLNMVSIEIDSLIGRTKDMSKIYRLSQKRQMIIDIIDDLTKLQEAQISPPTTAKRIVITFE